MVPVDVDVQICHFCVHKYSCPSLVVPYSEELISGPFIKQILVNKSEKSDHPPQQEPWCFVEVVNKVSVRDKTSSPQHSRCSYASGALIRIYFHPETAEKIAPHCMARLDLDNCSCHNFHQHHSEN